MRGDESPAFAPEVQVVSIRAPHFHAGRPDQGVTRVDTGAFQSAPRTFMRGDMRVIAVHDGIERFNPRPALSCGATNASQLRSTPSDVSIRAPHFHAGRREGLVKNVLVLIVSIRAPHFHAGRPGSATMDMMRSLFQSAPRTFMRGDRLPGRGRQPGRGFNPRPALSCGATGTLPFGQNRIQVSIRAPHFHAGRRQPRPAWWARTCFNPRPALSCGATILDAMQGKVLDVSIRAPHFHAGRLHGMSALFP